MLWWTSGEERGRGECLRCICVFSNALECCYVVVDGLLLFCHALVHST